MESPFKDKKDKQQTLYIYIPQTFPKLKFKLNLKTKLLIPNT